MQANFIERRFELGDVSEIILRSAWPIADGENFRCEYEITWPDRTRVSESYGVDQVQALILAMQKAHVDLLASHEWKHRQLRYLGLRDLDLPLPQSIVPEDFEKTGRRL